MKSSLAGLCYTYRLSVVSIGGMMNVSEMDLKTSPPRRSNSPAREGLVRARNFIWIATGIFLIGALIGLTRPGELEPLLDSFEDYVQKRFIGRSLPLTILLIFIQNFMTALISVVLGVLFGIVPALSAIINGILLGKVISDLSGSGQLHELWKILPHGIFELPAIFIAWGTGMWFGAWILRKDKSETLGSRGRRAVLVLMTYCAPLLIVAAAVEGYFISV